MLLLCCTFPKLLADSLSTSKCGHLYGQQWSFKMSTVSEPWYYYAVIAFHMYGTPEQSCVIRFGSRILTNCWSFSVGILSFFSLWKTGFDLGCSLFLTNSYCYGWTVLQLVAGWDTNMPKNVGNWKMLNSDVAPLSMSPWQTDCSWPHVCSLQCMNTNKVCVTGKLIYLE